MDSTDLHSLFGRQNYYGPVLFEFNVSLVKNNSYEIWITKDNPIRWNKNTTNKDRYFQNIVELRHGWDKFPKHQKMITIRNNFSPILFESIKRVVVDDPKFNSYFSNAKKLIKENIPNSHILKGKFQIRKCTNCFCRDNYMEQVSEDDMKRLFLK